MPAQHQQDLLAVPDARSGKLRHTPSGMAVCSLDLRRQRAARTRPATGPTSRTTSTSPSGCPRARTARSTWPRGGRSASRAASSGGSGTPRTERSVRRSRSSPTTSSSSAAVTAAARAAASSSPRAQVRRRAPPPTSPRLRPTTTSRSRRHRWHSQKPSRRASVGSCSPPGGARAGCWARHPHDDGSLTLGLGSGNVLCTKIEPAIAAELVPVLGGIPRLPLVGVTVSSKFCGCSFSSRW